MSEILKMKNIEKTYITKAEKLVVLENINITLKQGTTTVITGESGCGKSTFLNLIGGLDHVSGGEIFSAGYRVSHLAESELTEYRNRIIGFIFQFHYLLKDFTALENVMLPSFMGGSDKRKAVKQAEILLSQVGMEKRADHYPSQLSGGERQRVAVARSLINDPYMILADEPTGNLDEKNSRNVEEILFSLVKKYEKTLILVTHDTTLLERADRFFRLEAGSLLER